jgi:hypothetical protein
MSKIGVLYIKENVKKMEELKISTSLLSEMKIVKASCDNIK